MKKLIIATAIISAALLQGCASLKPDVPTPVAAQLVQNDCHSNDRNGNNVYSEGHCGGIVLEDVDGNQKRVRLASVKRVGEWTVVNCYLSERGQDCKSPSLEWNNRRTKKEIATGTGRFIL